jgi:hypothetical protein
VESNDIDRGTSIALDNGGEPHIAYFEYVNYKIKLASRSGGSGCTGGSWSVRDVNSNSLAAGLQTYPKVNINSSGDIYVTYRSGSLDNAFESAALPELPFELLPLVMAAIVMTVFMIRKNRRK